MTSLMGAKKRAEEFAAVVDGGADPARLHPELLELVGVVSGLRAEAAAQTQLTPRPEFTARLREQLLAEAATALTADNVLTLPPRRKGSRERRLALVASSLVLVGGTAGMAAAAQSALPGEALYPIKRGLEKAQAGFASDQAAKGHDLLDAADSRLVEVQGLFASSANLSQVPSTLDDFTAQALEATALLLDEYDQSGDPALIEELHAFTAANLTQLQELAKTASPEHQDELAMAADVLLQIDQEAQAACPTCTSAVDSLELPPMFLTAVDAHDALEAVARVKINNDHPMITAGDQPGRSRRHQNPDGGKDATGPADTGGATTTHPGGDAGETGDLDGSGSPNGDGSGGTGLPDPTDGGLTNGGLTNGVSPDGAPSGDTGSGSGGAGTGDATEDALPPALDPVVDTLLP